MVNYYQWKGTLMDQYKVCIGYGVECKTAKNTLKTYADHAELNSN